MTSIVFALEVTGQANALLPLLAACTASYFVSFFLMESTIMTEKITRRGVKTPDSYEPDILDSITVSQVLNQNGLVINENNTLAEVREWLEKEKEYDDNYFIIVSNEREFRGIISSSNLFSSHHPEDKKIGDLIKRKIFSIGSENSLRSAVGLMAAENIDILPVVLADNSVIGILTYKDILSAYKPGHDVNVLKDPSISLKRQGLKMLVRGQKLMDAVKGGSS